MPVDHFLKQLADKPPRHATCRNGLFAVVFVAASGALLGSAVVVNAPWQDGQYVAYPVTLDVAGTPNIAGIQFDITLDPNMEMIDVLAGPAALNSGKDVVFSELDDNTFRVLVVGLNQDQLASGVVANIYVASPQQANAAPSLEITGPVMSDPAGNPVSSPQDPQDPDHAEDTDPDDDADTGDDADPFVAPDGPASPGESDTGSKDAASANQSKTTMPALLDAFLGDYSPLATDTARETTSSKTDAAKRATAGAAPDDDSISEVYAPPGALPPQVYRTAAASTTAAHRPNSKPPTPASQTNKPHQVAPTENSSPPSVSVDLPMRLSSVPASVINTPKGAVAVPAPQHQNLDIKPYVNRRTLLPAAACVVALVLVLRNSILPLLRLLKRVRP